MKLSFFCSAFLNLTLSKSLRKEGHAAQDVAVVMTGWGLDDWMGWTEPGGY